MDHRFGILVPALHASSPSRRAIILRFGLCSLDLDRDEGVVALLPTRARAAISVSLERRAMASDEVAMRLYRIQNEKTRWRSVKITVSGILRQVGTDWAGRV